MLSNTHTSSKQRELNMRRCFVFLALRCFVLHIFYIVCRRRRRRCRRTLLNVYEHFTPVYVCIYCFMRTTYSAIKQMRGGGNGAAGGRRRWYLCCWYGQKDSRRRRRVLNSAHTSIILVFSYKAVCVYIILSYPLYTFKRNWLHVCI